MYPRYFKESIDGEYGKGGFLSKESYADITGKIDPTEIIMEINSKLMDIADSGKGLGKIIDALLDMRVDYKEFRKKLAITFPLKVSKNPKLVSFYTKLTKESLANV
jgi:hypothetical protein